MVVSVLKFCISTPVIPLTSRGGGRFDNTS